MKELISHTEIKVRFSETDSLGIVWHGHYVKYFEDGREDFGRKHGLHYLDVFNQGFVIPVVKLNCEYKKALVFGDSFFVETKYIPTPAAKIIFEFKIYKGENKNEIYSIGRSEQVFLDKAHKLQLYNPDFYSDWKKNWEV